MLIAAAAIIAGFAILIWSADLFIEGAAAIASNLGMSPIVIGMTIVSIGTSAPEILVSLTAALAGSGDLAIGNAMGSNIANIGLVLGLTLLITPLVLLRSTVKKELLILMAATVAVWLMLADNVLSGPEGWLSMSAMVGVLIYFTRTQVKDTQLQQESEEEPQPQLASTRAWLTFAAGLLLLIVSSRMLVWGAVIVARQLGISELLVGLTVIAVGTSLPELAATVASALRGHTDLAIGNVIGSNLFNLLAVLAIPGIVSAQSLAPAVLSRDYPAMALMTLLLGAMVYFGRRRKAAPPGHSYLGRMAGVLLVSIYALYYYLLYLSL